VFDQNRAFNEKSSADAFPQVFFLIQLIDFHSHEITPRDNTPDPTALDDWDMTKAGSAHLPQRVDCAVIGRNRDWIGRHRVRQRGSSLPSARARTASRPVKMPRKRCCSSITSTDPAFRSLMRRQACCTVSWADSVSGLWSLTMYSSFRLVMVPSFQRRTTLKVGGVANSRTLPISPRQGCKRSVKYRLFLQAALLWSKNGRLHTPRSGSRQRAMRKGWRAWDRSGQTSCHLARRPVSMCPSALYSPPTPRRHDSRMSLTRQA